MLSFEEIKNQLEEVLETQEIYNVDYIAIKESGNRLLEKELDVMRSNYRARPDFDAMSATSDFMWDTLGSYISNFPSKKMMKSFDAIEDQQAREDFQAIVDRWMEVTQNFKAAKAFVVKGRKPSTTPRKTKERTIENTGTCACCGKNVKLKDGKIVAHGYTIRWGFQSGNCFGVGYDPIEVSNEGLVAFKEALMNQLKSDNEKRAKFEAERPVIIRQTRHGKVLNEWKDGEEGYENAYRNRMMEMTRKIEMTVSYISKITNQINNWTPGKLPG